MTDHPIAWRRDGLALVLLLLAPLIWVGPAVFGDVTFVPLELAQYPPWSLHHTDVERAQIAASPMNTDVTETQVVFGPEFELAASEHAAGRFPAWNPYARFGAPLFAPGLTALLEPFNALLLWADDPYSGLAWRAWITLAAAGLLTYMLLRELRLGPLAAGLGAVAFAYGGTVTANLHFYNRVDALVWLPGILFACCRAADRRGLDRVPATLLLAALTALTWLSGFLPFSAPVMLLAGFWSLFLIVSTARRDGAGEALSLAGMLCVGVVLGIALTAVQLIPALTFYPESNRDLVPAAESLQQNGYDPAALLGLLMPRVFIDCFSTPPSPANNPLLLLWTLRSNWESGAPLYPPNLNYTEYALFPGVPALLCIPFAVLGLFTRREGGPRRTGAVLVTLGLFLALALGTRWTSVLHELPLLRNIQPMRFAGPLALPLAMAAGFGFEQLRHHAGRTRAMSILAIGSGLLALALLAVWVAGGLWHTDASMYPQLLDRFRAILPAADVTADQVRTFLGTARIGEVDVPALELAHARIARAAGYAGAITLATGLVFGALWWFRDRKVHVAAPVALLALLAFDLWSNGRDVAGSRHLLGLPRTSTHEFLTTADQEAAPDGGIAVLRVVRAGTPVTEPYQLPVCTLFPHRIRDLNTYNWVDHWSSDPLRALYPADMLIRNTWPRALPDDERLDLPLFDAMGASHLLAHFPAGVAATLQHAEGPVHLETGPNGSLAVFARPNVLPRAWIADEVVALPDEEAIVERMVSPDWRPAHEVLVTAQVAEDGLANASDPRTDVERAARTVHFVRDDADHVELEIAPGAGGLLVLRDAALSGWRATLDGEAAAIIRGNAWMRVVPVPASTTPSTVAFRYTTPGLSIGCWISRTALFGLLALTVVWAVRRRRAVSPEAAPQAA